MIYENVYKVYKKFKEGSKIDIPKGCLILKVTTTLEDMGTLTVINMLVPVKLSPTQENGLEEIPNLIKDEYED